MKRERYIAIDNVCAWPNLTRLPDGDIIATIFNQPCHGRWEGDVECWASADGRFWTKRGIPAPHEPGTNRMNVAAGLATNGDLLVLASGWDNRPPRPDPMPVLPHEEFVPPAGTSFAESRVLPTWVCRSTDAGRTWTRAETVAVPDGMAALVPFGDIQPGADTLLGAAAYRGDRTWFLASHDDGRTWPEHRLIAEGYNETALLHLGDGRWLAAARSAVKDGTRLFRSEDNGRAWTRECRLSLAGEFPGHLLRLADGRLLFSCGMRNPGFHGVTVRFSEDEGRTWSPPHYLVEYDPLADGGYPSSAQLEDGTIVTAYYSRETAHHQRYHMGVLRWQAVSPAQ